MQLVIISGPPNAGKSAAAEALCQRYDRMLHVDVSVLGGFLRMGRLRPWDETPEGRRQRELLIRSACDIAGRFVDAGYGVVIDDIALDIDVPIYRHALAGCGAPVHFIVLLPELSVLLDRERERPTEWHRAGRLEAQYARFQRWLAVPRIDPDALSPALVADRVMALAGEGRALLR
jgi:AAA domain